MLNEVNWILVVISLIISVVLGTFWYGKLFGKKWMKLMGITQKQMLEAKKKGMIKSGMAYSYGIMMASSLVMVVVLSLLLGLTGKSGALEGAKLAFLVWLGFIATISTGSVSWEGKPWTLWLINSGYQLVNLLIIGAILGAWQ